MYTIKQITKKLSFCLASLGIILSNNVYADIQAKPELEPNFSHKRIDDAFVLKLNTPHRVMSTSYINGGLETLHYLVNHQSVKPGDYDRLDEIMKMGRDRYHDLYLRSINVSPRKAALMGTAANMDTIAHHQRVFESTADEISAGFHSKPLVVDAWVSAGVCGNALTAGDPAKWYQAREGNKAINYSGTINTMVVINYPVSDSVLSKAIIVATEAKASVMHTLKVPSLQGDGIATGTGTDQIMVAAPYEITKYDYMLESASGHLKLGELIGATVKEATMKALINQGQVKIINNKPSLQCRQKP